MTSNRELRRNAQRDRILDAARVQFAERGLDQVTMADVAKLAGVARATVFNYFPSKYALLEAITDEVLGYYLGMLERALADTTTPTATLVRALFDHMGAGIQQYHAFHRGVFREIVKIQVGLDEGGEAERTRAASLGLLEQVLRRGKERGELTPDTSPEDLSRAFDSLANGTIVHWLYDGTSGSLRERMQRAAEIFLGPVAIDCEATRGETLPDLAPEFGMFLSPVPSRPTTEEPS